MRKWWHAAKNRKEEGATLIVVGEAIFHMGVVVPAAIMLMPVHPVPATLMLAWSAVEIGATGILAYQALRLKYKAKGMHA